MLPRQIRESKQKASVNSGINILSQALIKAAFLNCVEPKSKSYYIQLCAESTVVKKSGHNCNNFKICLQPTTSQSKQNNLKLSVSVGRTKYITPKFTRSKISDVKATLYMYFHFLLCECLYNFSSHCYDPRKSYKYCII